MINFIKAGFDVTFQYPAVTAGPVVVDLGDRVLRAPVRAEPIRARLEVRLENRLKNCLQASLDHPVSDSGNT
jgi:hypothetical protein